MATDKRIDLISTLPGSLLESFFPAGWNLEKIEACCSNSPDSVLERQSWWHRDFVPIPCEGLADFDVMLGHELACQIRRVREQGNKLILVLPVGPMGMYRWAVYFLKEWNIACDHVYGFNMDEWSNAAGETLPAGNPGSFQYAMEE